MTALPASRLETERAGDLYKKFIDTKKLFLIMLAAFFK